MRWAQVIGAVLLALGILALAYRGFTYTKETHEAKLGPLQVTVKDRERVDIPVWVGAGVALAGGALLAWRGGSRTKRN